MAPDDRKTKPLENSVGVTLWHAVGVDEALSIQRAAEAGLASEEASIEKAEAAALDGNEPRWLAAEDLRLGARSGKKCPKRAAPERPPS